ncbi:homeobox domain protein [Oesophagostomum dentatum]|uniref:Homeobox domain protein n=1 Tax=Oesophagostomum dentatum TaxID=61180 RepID=A0A0B1S8W8_OESDE|nr:homeobox domain protein [Oesophagostomum dentatum]
MLSFLQAIFKETKRPSREMQLTISQQLGLDPTTVANFFMNARRRGHDQKPDDEMSVSSGGSHAAAGDAHRDAMLDEQVLSPPPPTPIFEQL